MLILIIDSSTQALGLAVIKGEELLTERIAIMDKNHSVKLMPAIQSMLQELDLTTKNLEGIAVAIGPGSYTGIRVGVTTAKLLAYSLAIPLYSLSSLEIICYSVQQGSYLLAPFMDARKGNVFIGLYEWSSGIYVKKSEECITPFSQWLLEHKDREQPILFLSQDIDLHREQISSALGHRAILMPKAFAMPRLSLLTSLLAAKNPVENPHLLVPNYLQLAEAEIKYLQSQPQC
jgi:tRNA threonylcarbamoyladenosine biosynthesis protein TsaB